MRLRYATLVIQSQYRGRQARLLKKRLLYEAKAIVIQRAVRAFLGRRSFIAIRKKVILLQCCARRLIAKREMKKLKVSWDVGVNFRRCSFHGLNLIIDLTTAEFEATKV